MNNQVNLSALTSDLLTAKMIQSKLDGRLAVINKIEGGRVFVTMKGLGAKNFSISTITNGFIFIMDNASLVKCYFASNYSLSDIFNEEGAYRVACEIHDDLNKRFPDLMCADIYRMLISMVDEINRKSGL